MRAIDSLARAVTAFVLALFIPVTTVPAADGTGVQAAAWALARLPVIGSVLFVAGHPDDETYMPAVLPYASYGLHARTGLFTLNRGETGHNVKGSETGETLGLVRIGELLAAGRYYAVEQQLFSRFADWGVQSKADTLAKLGREELLAEVVKAVRIFRPTVIVSVWPASERAGHGHHQVAAEMAVEAFRAAGDPKRFPEQLRAGLRPWQPKKLYLDAHGFGSEPEPNWTLRIDGRYYDPLLGRSYQEQGVAGARMHITQGMHELPWDFRGEVYWLRLADATLPLPEGKETSLFDGLKVSLEDIPEYVGLERSALAFLDSGLRDLNREVARLLSEFNPWEPDTVAPEILRGLETIRSLRHHIESTSVPEAAKAELLFLLGVKERDFVQASLKVLGLRFEATSDPGEIIPGGTVEVSVKLTNGSSYLIEVAAVEFDMPAGWKATPVRTGETTLTPRATSVSKYRVIVPETAEYTQPFWHWSPEDRYWVRAQNPALLHLPEAPPDKVARVYVRIQGTGLALNSPLQYDWRSPLEGVKRTELAVIPPLSVAVEPGWLIAAPSTQEQTAELSAIVTHMQAGSARGTLRVNVPAGWRAEPSHVPFELEGKGLRYPVRFWLRIPPGVSPGKYEVEVVARVGEKEYAQGYRVITGPLDWVKHQYRPSVVTVNVVDVRVPTGLRVGYILGPSTFKDYVVPEPFYRFRENWQRIGVTITPLSDEELASSNLSVYDCIVVGYQAYSDTRKEVRAANPRLLEYVFNGGLLIVQAQLPEVWNRTAEGLGPYPSRLLNMRIYNEEAPVHFLQPSHRLVTWPNRITPADFHGWDEDLGVRFFDMKKSDPRYDVLFAVTNGYGEPEETGGMVLARYGRGTYAYSGFYLIHQTFLGTSPAFRILANLFALARPVEDASN